MGEGRTREGCLCVCVWWGRGEGGGGHVPDSVQSEESGEKHLVTPWSPPLGFCVPVKHVGNRYRTLRLCVFAFIC